MSHYYDMDGKPMTMPEWAKAFERSDRTLGWDKRDGVTVSTVWLGLDHNLRGDGPPLIFETMIFNGDEDEYQERYSTREEAEAGHKRAVAQAFGEGL